jgi:hypothetical protein
MTTSDEVPLLSSSVVNENEHQEPQLSLIQPEEEAEDQNEMNYEQMPQPILNDNSNNHHPEEQEDYPRRELVKGEEDNGIKITETTISMIVNNIDENEEYPPVEEESIAENTNLTSSKSFVIPQDSNGDNIQVNN